uniref:Homeobox domain-containing protein n=1 Tax=Hemiselmis tepida TaxID=464990 RepID=A0A7S0VQN3_9CRYP|mmetsp:Transcript_21702/g.54785  ORF Transcript_21702/g.54785 Transcript_21702/m.54785 type:complete len:228 (+) Transcript_21702:241-924(+)
MCDCDAIGPLPPLLFVQPSFDDGFRWHPTGILFPHQPEPWIEDGRGSFVEDGRGSFCDDFSPWGSFCDDFSPWIEDGRGSFCDFASAGVRSSVYDSGSEDGGNESTAPPPAGPPSCGEEEAKELAIVEWRHCKMYGAAVASPPAWEGGTRSCLRARRTHLGRMPQPSPRRRRRNLPQDVVRAFLAWIEQNAEDPYPSKDQKMKWVKQMGLKLSQVTTWFINFRKRNV